MWALPTLGGQHDLPRLVSGIFDSDFPQGAPLLVRALWEAREKIGAWLGWDRREAGLGNRVPALRDRLPADLPVAPSGPEFAPFTPLYSLEDEWAAELANRTAHAVVHLGWVPEASGGYRGQMAVLVRPNGRLGAAHMNAIKPFRYLTVYPALIRKIGRNWEACA